MLLDRNLFLIKERVAFAKLTDTYDILDPETKQPVGIAREEPPRWAKLLRILLNKQLLPTTVNVYEQETQPPLFSIRKPALRLRPRVSVYDAAGNYVGRFKSKLFSVGAGFWVYDADENQVAEVKGDWKGWNFTFLSVDGRELGKVTKQWAGIGKELFTSADVYMISIGEPGEGRATAAMLLLAAGLAIDIVYK